MVRQRKYVDEIHVVVSHVSVAICAGYEKSTGPKLSPETRTPYAAREGTLLRSSEDNTGAAHDNPKFLMQRQSTTNRRISKHKPHRQS